MPDTTKITTKTLKENDTVTGGNISLRKFEGHLKYVQIIQALKTRFLNLHEQTFLS